jgi:hypothetical protein
MSLYYSAPAAASGGPRPAVVTILARRAELKFAPAMSH